MKAIVYQRYGPPDVLRLREVDKPAPRDDEILIRILATTVTSGNWKLRRAGRDISPLFWLPLRLWLGLRKPKRPILGSELAGVVEAVGRDVNRFRRGDEVFGCCAFGTHAEYVCLPEDAVVAAKPANMSFAEAAAVPVGALTALFFLRDKGDIRSGQEVLVYGASGAVGTFAVQLARHFGARVTGVCSAANLDLVRSLGADEAIDYAAEDFARRGRTYDIIFDTVGKTSFSQCRGALKRDGRYLLTVFGLPQLARMLWTSMTGGPRVVCAMTEERVEDLVFLKELVEAGELRSAIDRRYPLERTAEAHAYVEKGHKKGNVVIVVDGGAAA